MDRPFSHRIEAEIRRRKIDSAQAEESAQLEQWTVAGAPAPCKAAERFSNNTSSG